NKLKNEKVFIKSEVWLGRIESEPVEITIVAPKVAGDAGRKQQSVQGQQNAPSKIMTDEQMLKRAVEIISKEDPIGKVTLVQSQNQHLGHWALKNPLPE